MVGYYLALTWTVRDLLLTDSHNLSLDFAFILCVDFVEESVAVRRQMGALPWEYHS